MNDRTPTEQDLRGALQSLVPEDLDAAGFRHRLDRALAGAPAPAPPARDDTIVALDLAEGPDRRRWSRLALVVTMAACVAAILAITLAVLPGDTPHHRRTPLPVAGAPTPAAIRSMIFPGTVVLHTYVGRGTRTFAVAPLTVPEHYGYSVYGTCHGTGDLTVGQSVMADACSNGAGAFGLGAAVVNGRLTITAAATTSWRLTLTLAPDARTNGSIQSPVDADMTGPDTGRRQSGRGSGTARFTGDPSDTTSAHRYRLRLVCRGSGVTLPGLKADQAAGLTTRTCFAGQQYVWDDVTLTTPAEVSVHASAGTTWTIVIDSM